MKLGEQTSTLLSQHNSMAILLNAALGSKDKKTPPKPGQDGVKDIAAGHQDLDSAVAAINAMMTI